MHTLVKGLIAGAAGTTALNTVSYLDMLVRARAASSTPRQAVAKLSGLTHTDLGDGDRAANRTEALGSLMGYATGVASAIAYGFLSGRRRSWPVGVLALTALAMSGSNVPLTLLDVTHPSEWPADAWVSDVVPHLAYGITAYAAYELMR
ncbi:hypothetical protein ACWCSD_26960 [Nonomuraea sp. NPDC001684]